MKRRISLLLVLLILLTFVIVNAAAAREECLPTPNGYYLYLPLIMKPGVCSGEGEVISLMDPAQVCCPGLATIEAAEPNPDGGCSVAGGMAICTYCGDGACGLGENICNCPVDC
jgi:hypothetical protein